MLQLRFLFDKYIVKREYIGDDKDGVWSLKELCVSGSRRSKKPYFKNTIFKEETERDSPSKKSRTKNNLMLESALRVSYTSPKVMHWITEILTHLAEKVKKGETDFSRFTEVIENIAKKAVKDNFFNCENDNYLKGVETPHIVFNYLDYLLWKKEPQKYEDFVFEYRNSVEHWYPQNPSEGTFDAWEDGGVDTFGNLCIIQRNINSKFSNLAPEAKKNTFDDMIKKGSIKLRLMSDLTKTNGNRNSSYCWKNEKCSEHEKEMIKILKDACGIE